jgi:hypothetical protein
MMGKRRRTKRRTKFKKVMLVLIYVDRILVMIPVDWGSLSEG